MAYLSLSKEQIDEILALSDQLSSGTIKDLKEFRDQSPRDQAIVAYCQMNVAAEGHLEIDDGALVSEGDDNGAYIMAWYWVDFSGTPLDKEM